MMSSFLETAIIFSLQFEIALNSLTRYLGNKVIHILDFFTLLPQILF